MLSRSLRFGKEFISHRRIRSRFRHRAGYRPLSQRAGEVFGVTELRSLRRLLPRSLCDGSFGSLEPDARMGTVTEGLVHRAATAAKRKRHLAGQVIWLAIWVHQLNRALGSLHAVRPVLAARDFHLCHISPPLYPARGAVRLL